MLPSDRTALSEGPVRLRDPFPEEGNRAGFEKPRDTAKCLTPSVQHNYIFSEDCTCFGLNNPTSETCSVTVQTYSCVGLMM